MNFWNIALQVDRRIAAIFVRYRFGESDFGYLAPFQFAALTAAAGWVRLWLWPVLTAPGRPTIDWSAPEAFVWPLFSALVLAIGLLHVAGSLHRWQTKTEVNRYARGTPQIMRLAGPGLRRDPRRFTRKWTMAQLFDFEPLVGVAMTAIAAEVSVAFALYVGTAFSLLWWDSAQMARARRGDRLAYREALSSQLYREFVFEEAQKGVERARVLIAERIRRESCR